MPSPWTTRARRELARELLVAAAAPLEHGHGDLLGLERARHVEPDPPASDDEHLPGRRRGAAHEHQDVGDHVAPAHDVDVVLGRQRGVVGRARSGARPARCRRRGREPTPGPSGGRAGAGSTSGARAPTLTPSSWTRPPAKSATSAAPVVLMTRRISSATTCVGLIRRSIPSTLPPCEDRVLAELDVADTRDLGGHAVLVRDGAGDDVHLVHVRHRDHHRRVPDARRPRAPAATSRPPRSRGPAGSAPAGGPPRGGAR